MKAILVIDMPKGCCECNCAIDLCHGTIPSQEWYNKRPSWCPLKPMPSPKINKRTEEWLHMTDRERYFYGIGFNDAKFQWNKEIGGEW